MQQMAPGEQYSQLTHIQKLEVFQYALENTAGEDLAKILWLKSKVAINSIDESIEEELINKLPYIYTAITECFI